MSRHITHTVRIHGKYPPEYIRAGVSAEVDKFVTFVVPFGESFERCVERRDAENGYADMLAVVILAERFGAHRGEIVRNENLPGGRGVRRSRGQPHDGPALRIAHQRGGILGADEVEGMGGVAEQITA